MNEQLRWDDLRIVQAIAETGSLAGAGRRLGASHATVFRRLNAIEARLGVALFERSRSGYAPTAAGEDLAAVAARVEAEVLGAERRVAGRDLRLSGTLRVTTTDTLLMGLLSRCFAAFRREHPEIVLEVAISNRLFNLSQRDGLGVAVLPCYLADAEPSLGRLGEPIPELATDLWLLTHPDLRRVARIRAFMARMAEALERRAARLDPDVDSPRVRSMGE